MPKYRIVNSQTGYLINPEADLLEADSLEEAQAIILEGEGMKVEEVE